MLRNGFYLGCGIEWNKNNLLINCIWNNLIERIIFSTIFKSKSDIAIVFFLI